MTKKQKKKFFQYAIDFIKLQVSGNVLFWGTYLGYFLLHEFADWSSVPALATASIIAHAAFFMINRQWVFNDKTGERKTRSEIIRFVLFMGLNYFINLGIITGLHHYFAISPYIGQFIAAFFFTIWNFVGLRFWVFPEVSRRASKTKSVKGGKRNVRRK